MAEEKQSRRPSEIAADFGIDHQMAMYYGTAHDERPAELWQDINYLHYWIKSLSPKGGLIPAQLLSCPVHLYEIYRLDCNAACWFAAENIEIAMFAGLRDVIFLSYRSTSIARYRRCISGDS